MPCNSDYMEPNQDENLNRETHEHLCYVYQRLGKEVPISFKHASQHIYGQGGLRLSQAIRLLCETIRKMDKDEQEVIMYNGRNPQARKLADWWDRHCTADAIREETEEAIRNRALSKLSQEERKVLGL